MAADGEDYEHWPDDGASVMSTGYNDGNGLRRQVYQPADVPMEDASKPEAPRAANYTYAQPVHPHIMGYPSAVPYGYYEPVGYPPPGYYGLPIQCAVSQPAPAYIPIAGNGNEYEYAPAKAEKKVKSPKLHKWQGRTKAEVDEDNMLMAKREGAWDERKVEPVGLAPDQMVWCVETDGTNTLR